MRGVPRHLLPYPYVLAVGTALIAWIYLLVRTFLFLVFA